MILPEKSNNGSIAMFHSALLDVGKFAKPTEHHVVVDVAALEVPMTRVGVERGSSVQHSTIVEAKHITGLESEA
jgi:hypothetical protein